MFSPLSSDSASVCHPTQYLCVIRLSICVSSDSVSVCHPTQYLCASVDLYVFYFLRLSKSVFMQICHAWQISPLATIHDRFSLYVYVCVCLCVGVCQSLRKRMFPDSLNSEKSLVWNRTFAVKWRVCFFLLDTDLHFQGQTFGILFDWRISRKRWEIEQTLLLSINRKSRIYIEWRNCECCTSWPWPTFSRSQNFKS